MLCKGITKNGNLCTRYTVVGEMYCRTHQKQSLDVFEELECPVCLEDYIPIMKAVCGHHVCKECSKSMKESGRTICCPLCRDDRFSLYTRVN
jgi:hypothetical protein